MGFSGSEDSPYLRVGIRDYKAKWGRDSVLKVSTGCGTPKITLGISCFVLRVPNRFFGI